MTDNFDFKLIEEIVGYNSSREKTNLNEKYMIRGSLNVYKDRSGNIVNRPGLKRRGDADATLAGIKSSFEWKIQSGQTRPLRVKDETSSGAGDAKIQVEFDGEWIDLITTSTLVNPALTKTRFVFATWWDSLELKDWLLFVRGTPDILYWSGGISKIAAVTTVTGSIRNDITISNTGASYVAGDILTIVGGDAQILVNAVSGGAITNYTVISVGSGYTNGVTAVTGGTGTGATFTVSTQDTYNLTKQDTTTTWFEDGFSDRFRTTPSAYARKKLILNSIEYTYISGEDSDTLKGFTSQPVGSSGDIAIQPVFVETDEPNSGVDNDFLTVQGNQVVVGGYSSRTLYISLDVNIADYTSSTFIETAFAHFTQVGSHVDGDADYCLLDDNCNGLVGRDGKVYASGGVSDWYEITLNYPVPVSYTDSSDGLSRFVITRVIKKQGTGLSGLLAHEFSAVVDNNIIYLGKDNQMRSIGTFTNIEGAQFPIISQEVYDELKEEDFTGGHLRSIEDIIYITAPVNGRHWMSQRRTNVNELGQITNQRLWNPPHVSGISRIAEIEGVVYGYSSQYPQIYQIWDTGQWYDDSPNLGDDGSYEQIRYLCVMRMAYRNHGRPQGLGQFGKVYYEGFMATGTDLYGNIFHDYQGSTKRTNVEINTEDNPTNFFIGNPAPALGDGALGDNPLGAGLIPESSERDRLPKFRSIRDVSTKKAQCFEYSLEVYSYQIGARWEMMRLGVNWTLAPSLPTFIRNGN